MDVSHNNFGKDKQVSNSNNFASGTDFSDNLSTDKFRDLKFDPKPSLVKRLTRVKMN